MSDKTVLVLGATGQQGGSAAAALTDGGWHVRALVRDPNSSKARALSAAGIEAVRGDLADTASVRAPVAGAYGVFSVQPSSGQFVYGVSDADEVRFGKAVADAAKDAGVKHLVYASANAAGSKTGVGHFDSKSRVEGRVRSLAIDSTSIRPSTFIEILLMPDEQMGEPGPQGAQRFLNAARWDADAVREDLSRSCPSSSVRSLRSARDIAKNHATPALSEGWQNAFLR